MDGKKSDILAILVNYNGLNDTIEAVESLSQSSYIVDICVVDNNSANDEGRKLQSLFDNVKVLLSSENLGFSGGNNLGIQYGLDSGYEYIMLINNDTIIDVDMVRNLRNFASKDIVTIPAMFYYSKPDILWYGGGKISRFKGVAYHIFEGKKLSQCTTDDCSFATGCCMLIHRDILLDIGFLSDDYFMYCEDTDFSIRLLLSNRRIKFVPRAKLWHKVGASSGGGTSDFTLYYCCRNRLLYISKYRKFFFFSALPYSILQLLVMSFKYMLHFDHRWKVGLKALLDFLKGVKGKSF